MTKQEKIELTSLLWQKHSYEDGKGLRSNRQAIIEEYESITGETLPLGTLKGRI